MSRDRQTHPRMPTLVLPRSGAGRRRRRDSSSGARRDRRARARRESRGASPWRCACSGKGGWKRWLQRGNEAGGCRRASRERGGGGKAKMPRRGRVAQEYGSSLRMSLGCLTCDMLALVIVGTRRRCALEDGWRGPTQRSFRTGVDDGANGKARRTHSSEYGNPRPSPGSSSRPSCCSGRGPSWLAHISESESFTCEGRLGGTRQGDSDNNRPENRVSVRAAEQAGLLASKGWRAGGLR